MLRFHATVPLPVPLPVVSVVQLFRLVAVHAVVEELSPLRVIDALLPVAAVPAVAVVLRKSGDTVIVSGTGAAVIRSVSMMLCEATPVAATVMVST